VWLSITTTPFLLILLNPSLLVSNTGPHTIHLLNNIPLCPVADLDILTKGVYLLILSQIYILKLKKNSILVFFFVELGVSMDTPKLHIDPRVPVPKSNLESIMERFLVSQTKTNEALGESVSQLNFKFKTMTTHQKILENQIAQIAQQVCHLSSPQRHLPG